jgi:DNA-binding MarR family transcriptional regulator
MDLHKILGNVLHLQHVAGILTFIHKGGIAMDDALRALGVVARALDSIANIEFRNLELTRGQYLYIVRIQEQAGIIQEQLVDLLKIDRATVARSVQKLVRQGLVTKKTSAANHKAQQLYLTPAGEEAADFIQRENKYSLGRALSGMSAEEQATLTRLLNQMEVNIDADWHDVKAGKTRQY